MFFLDPQSIHVQENKKEGLLVLILDALERCMVCFERDDNSGFVYTFCLSPAPPNTAHLLALFSSLVSNQLPSMVRSHLMLKTESHFILIPKILTNSRSTSNDTSLLQIAINPARLKNDIPFQPRKHRNSLFYTAGLR